MAVVVEPVLTAEKLRSLLAEACEQSSLDYKTGLDLSERRDVIELVKDVAAMQSEELGGYIVIGADDHGSVVPTLTSAQASLFDEARLRGKLQRYIAEPFDVRSAVHEVSGQNVALVYVAPNPEGWCIFKQDGEYPDPSGRMKVAFRVGDVFVRRGTASQKWDDSDRKRIVEQLMARRKDAWRVELRQEFAATIDIGLTAQRLEQMPTSAVTWQLDAAGFDELVTELIRRGDDIPLRRLLMQAPADAGQALASGVDELATLLDRVTSVAALALTYERPEWFDQAVKALVRVYELGFGPRGFRRTDIDTPRLWLLIMGRVYGLGGLAVRLNRWGAVRQLAIQRPHGQEFDHYTNWLRHAVTMASRAEILDEEHNSGLVARGHNVVRAVRALHPDVDANSDEVLDSICQFDALAALAIMSAQHNSGDYYPNFARYYTHRAEPAFAAVVSNPDVRTAIYPEDDELLAAAIRNIHQIAHSEGFRYSGWGGFEDRVVRRFLEEHPERDPVR